MPVVDHERAWVRLKAAIGQKRSHGADALLLMMSRLEVECEIPEGEEGFDGRPLPSHEPARELPAGDGQEHAMASH